jgi:hypothetical protein
LTFVQGCRRLVSAIADVTGVALIVETTLISMQVVRNTASHFNIATAFDGAVFGIMGTFIMLLAMANFALAMVLGFQRLPDPVATIDASLDLRAYGVAGEVIATPGHTAGSISIFFANGDAIVISLWTILHNWRRAWALCWRDDRSGCWSGTADRWLRMLCRLGARLSHFRAGKLTYWAPTRS